MQLVQFKLNLKGQVVWRQKIKGIFQTDETTCLRSKAQEYKEYSRGASSDFPACLRLCDLYSYQYIWPYGYNISKKFWSVSLENHLTVLEFYFFLWVKKRICLHFELMWKLQSRQCVISYLTTVSATTHHNMIITDICFFLYSLKSLITCLISFEPFNNLYFPHEELRLEEGLESKIIKTC